MHSFHISLIMNVFAYLTPVIAECPVWQVSGVASKFSAAPSVARSDCTTLSEPERTRVSQSVKTAHVDRIQGAESGQQSSSPSPSGCRRPMLMSVTSSRLGPGLSNNHVTFMSVHNACGRVAEAEQWRRGKVERKAEKLPLCPGAWSAFPGLCCPAQAWLSCPVTPWQVSVTLNTRASSEDWNLI